MVFFSAVLALLGCVEPPVVDPVTDTLAELVLQSAEPELRFFIGITGVIAETCPVDRMSEYTFRGEAAAALGVTRATVTESASGAKTWVFADVGLDGTAGNLVLTTDSARSTFSATYTVSNATVMTGAFLMVGCTSTGDPATDTSTDTAADTSTDTATGTGAADFDSYTAVVSGNIDMTSASATHHLYIEGGLPDSATTWSPPTALAPASGWAHWADNEQRPTEEVTLQDAANIDYPTRSWPATAIGSGWVRSVSVGLP